MKFLVYLSEFMIPFVLLYIVGFGILMKTDIYQEFVKGAEKGFKTVIGIMPTLIGLMVAVGILRASGFLDLLANTLGVITEKISLPSELLPAVLIRLFSSSAATGLVLDLFKEHGTDSYIGIMASIIMSCTEAVFYTMSVYFMAAGVKKTRYTISGALFATLAGIIASMILTNAIF